MKLIQFITNGVQFIPKHSCWFGTVNMTLSRDGEIVAHNVEVKVRTKGNLSQSYQEAQEAIRAEAISVLSQAIDTLRSGSFEDIDAKMDK
jgi:hypothetical protein